MNSSDLHTLITPTLLSTLHALLFPWPPIAHLTARTAFSYSAPHSAVHHHAFPALHALSRLPLPTALQIDFTAFLPAPSSSNYPAQALGLLILLDQAPRILFSTSSTNIRYVNAFFDCLAVKLMCALLALSWELRPDNPARWIAAGYSAECTAIRLVLMYAPLAHSEEWSDQAVCLGLVEGLRRWTEAWWEVSDGLRGEGDREVMRDESALARWFDAGFPTDDEEGEEREGKDKLPFYEYVFWFARYIRCHEPIVRRFGRFPYRNGSMGRGSTAEEEEFLRETKGWGACDESVAKLIREDIQRGVWRELVDDFDE